MKRTMAWILTAAMLLGLMAGCGKTGQNPQIPEEPEKEVLEQVSRDLSQRLDLTEEQAEDLVVQSARNYEEESIVRFAQTWQGVEVYGSSIVTSSEDESFVAGTYYDLSEAFGEDFDALVAQAAAVPDWMADQTAEGITVRFDRSSLRPVIYILEDDTAVVARCFTVTVEYEGESMLLELVTDPEGSLCYHLRELSYISGYRDTDVKSSFGDACTVAEEDGVYYAYNSTYNFYAAEKVYGSSSDIESSDYKVKKDGRMVLKWDESLIFTQNSDNWKNGDADLILRAMQSYYQVADWYYREFGYYCLDGQGGLGAVIVARDVVDTVAYNDSNILIVIEPGVVNAPEVLVHEYGHTLFQMETGTFGRTKNETAALKEAICDVFAALYLADQGDASWIIGEGAGDPKNIPGEQKTMDDYGYDRYMDNSQARKEGDPKAVLKKWFADALGQSFEDAGDIFFGDGEYVDPIYAGSGSSTERAHANAFIMTNTMYRIWKNVFDKDSEAFGRVFYRSLRYLPPDPDFGEFRVAFLYAVERMCDDWMVDAAAGEFDKAKIYGQIKDVIIRVSAATRDRENPLLIDFCNMRFSELQRQKWSSACTTGTYASSNIWVYDCFMEGAHIYFELYGDYEDPNGEVLFAIISDAAQGVKVTDTLIMGRTYVELAQTNDISEISAYGGGVWKAESGANGFALSLTFLGDSPDTAVLTEVQVMYVG